jgi:hypothetical protein
MRNRLSCDCRFVLLQGVGDYLCRLAPLQACSTSNNIQERQYSGTTVFRNAFSRQQHVLDLIFLLTIFLLTFLKQYFHARGLV